jgi:hypothetical protein
MQQACKTQCWVYKEAYVNFTYFVKNAFVKHKHVNTTTPSVFY